MTLFDYLQAYQLAVLADGLDAESAALSELHLAPVAELDATFSGPDLWLSGNEWSGEAEIGGMPLTSGTWDTSGEGAHVIAVDGEVLDLPPY